MCRFVLRLSRVFNTSLTFLTSVAHLGCKYSREKATVFLDQGTLTHRRKGITHVVKKVDFCSYLLRFLSKRSIFGSGIADRRNVSVKKVIVVFRKHILNMSIVGAASGARGASRARGARGSGAETQLRNPTYRAGIQDDGSMQEANSLKQLLVLLPLLLLLATTTSTTTSTSTSTTTTTTTTITITTTTTTTATTNNYYY